MKWIFQLAILLSINQTFGLIFTFNFGVIWNQHSQLKNRLQQVIKLVQIEYSKLYLNITDKICLVVIKKINYYYNT